MSRRRGPFRRALKAARMAVKNPTIEGFSGLAAAGLDRRLRVPEDLNGEPPREILVIRTDRIGDLLCGSPLIAALHARWPAATITLIGGPKNRSVMPLLPYVVRAPVEFERHPWSWARLRAWLGRRRFDIAVSLRSEVLSSAMIAGWSGAPVRAVANVARTLPAYNLVLGPNDRHQLRRCWNAAVHLGVTWPEQKPIVEVPPDAEHRAEHFVAGLPRRDGAPLVGAGVPNRLDSRHRVKALPPERIEALLRGLTERGAQVLLFGVGGERAEAERLRAAVPGVVVAPPMSLAQVAAVQRRLDLFVASYTGTLHLADAVGTPTVAMGMTGQYEDWGPIGARHRHVSAARVPDIPVEAILAAAADALGGRLAQVAGGRAP